MSQSYGSLGVSKVESVYSPIKDYKKPKLITDTKWNELSLEDLIDISVHVHRVLEERKKSLFNPFDTSSKISTYDRRESIKQVTMEEVD